MRLLTKTEAAEYCRVSVETFTRICPVRAIALQPGNPRLLRYDKNDLDEWIERLKDKRQSDGSNELGADDYLARLDP
jgi:helix-turn-helix protein